MPTLRPSRLTFVAEPVPGDDPCGPDLEYDDQMVALRLSATVVEAYEIGRGADGNAIVRPRVEPDWLDVADRAVALLERSRDLRVVPMLARALLETDGLDGLNDAIFATAAMVRRHWAALHPRGEAGDAGVRLEVLDRLGDDDGLLGALRAVRPVAGASGDAAAITLRAIAEENPVTPGTDATRLAESLTGVLRSLDDLVVAVRAHDATVPEGVFAIRRLLADAHCVCTLEAHAPTLDIAAPRAQPGTPVGTRAEARAALERAARYLEQAEPGHPAPLLIRRAQRLLDMSFLEIVADLAPDSVRAIREVAGVRDAA